MSDLNIGDHISHRFNEELESIRSKVMTMGGLVEKQVQDGLSALIDNDRELAELVSASDVKVNAMEVEIDEDCTRILAKRQPTASDLRLVVSIIKTITDLERIGDEAEKLGRYTLSLNDQGLRSRHYGKLQHLGTHVLRMLHDSLNSFAHMDAEAALRTIANDKKVNAEFESISRNLITHMMEDPREIANALRVTWCARALERIGDHSKNICEYVVYFVKGKDVRHVSLNQAAQSVDVDISSAIEDDGKPD